MQNWLKAAVTLVLAIGFYSHAALAGGTYGQYRASAFMRAYGQAQAPYGFVRFCEAMPAECAASGPTDTRFQATPERLSELDEINRYVNRVIEPATDLEIYGEVEYWTLPTTQGDCEDYALLKRHLLMARGWPVSALLMTVVKDEKGEGHAILTARTAQGDYVLDNKIQDVRIWSKAPYEFVMRQSFVHPRAWVFLDPREADTPLPLAGVQRP